MSAANVVPTQGDSVDRVLLQELEEVVDLHASGYERTGRALRTIRDSRLYREAAGTFEDYLRQRFRMARATGYRLIGAVDLLDEYRHVGAEAGVPKLETPREGTLRALARIPTGDRRPVLAWLVAQVQQGQKLTASLVRGAVLQVAPKYRARQVDRTLDRSQRKLDARLEALAHKLLDDLRPCAADRTLVLKRALVLARKTSRYRVPAVQPACTPERAPAVQPFCIPVVVTRLAPRQALCTTSVLVRSYGVARFDRQAAVEGKAR